MEIVVAILIALLLHATGIRKTQLRRRQDRSSIPYHGSQ